MDTLEAHASTAHQHRVGRSGVSRRQEDGWHDALLQQHDASCVPVLPPMLVSGWIEQRAMSRRRFFSELAPNFGILGAPLLRPEPGLAAAAAERYAANVPPGSTVVGTHIRFGMPSVLDPG